MTIPPVLEQANSRQSFYSGKASDVARHLTFAAVALIWLIATGMSGEGEVTGAFNVIRSSDSLTTAFGLAVGALTFDLLQYLWASAAWGTWRWTLDELGQADHTERLQARQAVAWFIARLVRYKKKIDFDLGLLKTGDKTRPKLAETRAALTTQHNSSVGDLWSPRIINRITALLFSAKMSAVGVCYLCLLYFIIQTTNW